MSDRTPYFQTPYRVLTFARSPTIDLLALLQAAINGISFHASAGTEKKNNVVVPSKQEHLKLFTSDGSDIFIEP